MQLDKAQSLMFTWKNEEQRDYAVKLVKAGYELVQRGICQFATDDIPEQDQPDDNHIAGLAVKHLINSGLIVPLKVHSLEHGSQQVMRKSKREKRNGAKIPLYYIANMGSAGAFLDRYKANYEKGQMELAV